MNYDNFIEQDGPAFETGRYAEKAESYCINKFGAIEGNEAIFAAILISQAICANRIGLMYALDKLNEKLYELDIRSCLDNIETAILKVEEGIADVVAYR